MRGPDEFEQELREIRMRKFRRMFDPFAALVDEDFDETPRRFYMRKVRAVLIERHAQDNGKRPFSVRPSWSLPSSSGRGRPVGIDHQRIPHTRNRVGGHQSDTGVAQAVIAERYNTRHEREVAAALANQTALVAAIGDDRYLNRLELDAIAGGMPSGLRTNMDPDPLKREREWTARTRHERKAGKPRINIKAERDPALCEAIAADPRWPEQLRIAILADLDRRSRGRDRPKSKTAGEPWIADEAETVLAEVYQAYGLDPEAADAALSFGRPRAGRVMYKWDAELPRELSEDRRQAYLDRIAAALDETGITYVLVMHRPDPLNHPDNFHVHLLYSDRPVAMREDGKFDIEQVVERDYGRGRHASVHQRQPKLRHVTERAWTATLRGMHVEECNRQLTNAGALGRYNVGGFADIGLADESAQRKLGTNAARLEAAGIATEAGVTNAFIDWERVDTRRQRRHAKRMERIAALHAARCAEKSVDAYTLKAWRTAAQRAEHARVAAEEIADTIAMALSRPASTSDKTAAIASSYPAGSYERHRWTERCADAETAMVALERDLATEHNALARTQKVMTARARERELHRQRLRTGLARAARTPPPVGTVVTPIQKMPEQLTAHRFIDRTDRLGIAVQDRGGRFGYDAVTLRTHGLSDADFASSALQARLSALRARQQREITSVAKLAAKGFVLDTRSDTPHVRAMIDRWQAHPAVMKSVPRVPPAISIPPEWKRAAAMCETMMAQSDTDERLQRDANGLIVRDLGRDRGPAPPSPARRMPPGMAATLGGHGR